MGVTIRGHGNNFHRTQCRAEDNDDCKSSLSLQRGDSTLYSVGWLIDLVIDVPKAVIVGRIDVQYSSVNEQEQSLSMCIPQEISDRA